MNKTVLSLVVIILILIVGYLFFFRAEVPVNEVTDTEKTGLEEGRSEGVRVITMKTGAFFFDPSSLVLKKGQPVRIEIENKGSHTFTIDELVIDMPINGPTAVVEFTPDKVGTFEFYCGVAGHRQQGQVGTLVVEE